VAWLSKDLDEIQMIEDEVRIGMFRVSKEDEVSINLHPLHRGKGYGAKVVSKYTPKGVWAKIVDGNVPSMRLFVENGFKVIDHKENYYILKYE
jgi:GNAT superfamily N-acetyltransferase